jgi:tetratricopeptide (TPR) repeat protein
VLGAPADHGTAVVLAAWSFVFCALPALVVLESRLVRRGLDPARAALWMPALAFVAGLAVFELNVDGIDRSAERGVSWARTALDALPDDAILLTRNPAVLALAADGVRPDVDVVDVSEPSTLTAFRGGRLLLPLGQEAPEGAIDGEVVAILVRATEGARSVFVDASVYFDLDLRQSLIGERWAATPHGLTFRLAEHGTDLPPASRRAAALAWEGLDLTPSTPPSPLRDGLAGSEYIARSLLQSAYLHLEQGRPEDAEREFLLAIGHPGANANVAAIGYSRFLSARRQWAQVAKTLETYTRDDEEGAWIARRLLGNTYLRLGDRERGLETLRRALRLVPASMGEERAKLQQAIRNLQGSRSAPPPGAE